MSNPYFIEIPTFSYLQVFLYDTGNQMWGSVVDIDKRASKIFSVADGTVPDL